MLKKALWIRTPQDIGTVSPEFRKNIYLVSKVKKATKMAREEGFPLRLTVEPEDN